MSRLYLQLDELSTESELNLTTLTELLHGFIASHHELSQQAFDNGLPLWSYQTFRNLGADYAFVGPAERERLQELGYLQ